MANSKKQQIVPARTEAGWIKCGNCGAKILKIISINRKGEPNGMYEHKCKAKHNGKTCNSFNRVLL